MAITSEIIGKLGGGGGFIWKPVGGVTYDLGPNFGDRIAITYSFRKRRSLSVNGHVIFDSSALGFIVIPDEVSIPNPRYITVGGSGTESSPGMFICVTPVESGISAPPTA